MQHYIEKMNLELNCVYVEKRERKKAEKKDAVVIVGCKGKNTYIYYSLSFSVYIYIMMLVMYRLYISTHIHESTRKQTDAASLRSTIILR